MGDVVAIDGAKIAEHNGSYIVESIGESQSNKEYTSYSLGLKRWIAHGIPGTVSA